MWCSCWCPMLPILTARTTGRCRAWWRRSGKVTSRSSSGWWSTSISSHRTRSSPDISLLSRTRYGCSEAYLCHPNIFLRGMQRQLTWQVEPEIKKVCKLQNVCLCMQVTKCTCMLTFDVKCNLTFRVHVKIILCLRGKWMCILFSYFTVMLLNLSLSNNTCKVGGKFVSIHYY